MPPKDFFDEFEEDVAAPNKVLFDDDGYASFKKLLLNDGGASMEDLQQQFTELVQTTLAAKGVTLQVAQTDLKDPWVAATKDLDEFEQLVKEVAAAASKNVLEKEEWVPPPPDKVPETDLDYQ